MTASIHSPRFSCDAAIVLALAQTAMTFAGSAEDEAERWVRVLRLHGEVGCALQALGVPEGPLENAARAPAPRGWRLTTPGEDVIDLVTRRAVRKAAMRKSSLVGTVDVLAALLDIYNRIFDRALFVRGTSREELLERLSETAARGRVGDLLRLG